MFGLCSTGSAISPWKPRCATSAPATDVHDELDLVTIPSVGKGARRRESPPRARPIPFGREDDRMPAPKGRYPPTR